MLSRGAYNLGGIGYGKDTTLSIWIVSDSYASLSEDLDCSPIEKPSRIPPMSRMIV